MRIIIRSEDLTQRNPVARALANNQFRVRKVRDRTKYTRKQKHRKRVE